MTPPDWDMNGDLTIAAYKGQAAALEKRNRQALRLLRQSYVTLAFAFRRLHQSSRSRDGELCLDFQKVRAEIESYFRDLGAPL
ncbi:MAG: hypothetical protein KGL35_17885, partial [Bradyrhizobium sp.]|nr:hypothetical protein [Bradyrhizobium sp.]